MDPTTPQALASAGVVFVGLVSIIKQHRAINGKRPIPGVRLTAAHVVFAVVWCWLTGTVEFTTEALPDLLVWATTVFAPGEITYRAAKASAPVTRKAIPAWLRPNGGAQ